MLYQYNSNDLGVFQDTKETKISENGDLFLSLRSTQETKKLACPKCGHAVHVNSRRKMTLKDLPSTIGTRTYLEVEYHQYRCQNCLQTFTEQIPFCYPGTRITKRLAGWVEGFLRWQLSIQCISSILGIHWDTVKQVEKDFIEKRLQERKETLESSGYKPRRLAVDEFAIHKGHTYATCVLDLDTKEVIWVGKERTIRGFRKFFDEVREEYLSEVEAIAMDMNASYNSVVQEKMPGAKIVYDRYHMQSQFGRDVLGQVRLAEARKHKEEAVYLRMEMNECRDPIQKAELKEKEKSAQREYREIKRARWPILTKSSKLQEKKAEVLEKILNTHADLAVCYAMKEEMCRLFELQDPGEAEAGWKAWFAAAKESGIPSLVKFAIQKEKRLDGLVNHASYPISTGPLEGTNNKIKVCKRIAYGFRDDVFFFSLIRYMTMPKVRAHV